MPARSKSQQRLMGMVYAYKKGKLDTKNMSKPFLDKIKHMASTMKSKDVKDFAQTKHADIKESRIMTFENFCNEGYHNNFNDHHKANNDKLYWEKIKELANKYQVSGGETSAPEIKKWIIDNDEDLDYIDDIYRELVDSHKEMPTISEKINNK
jgi:hypothetical protein